VFTQKTNFAFTHSTVILKFAIAAVCSNWG